MDNLELWNKVKQAPPSALKPIQAGRLKGKSDISPQWRYQALTEQFGQCGIGWKYTIDKLWTQHGANSEIFAFAQIELFVTKLDTGQVVWSHPIPGIGGSKLIQSEKSGLHNNDEGYKMAVTDALGTACKMLGLAADVYMGLWDGSKYKELPKQATPPHGDNGTKPPKSPEKSKGNETGVKVPKPLSKTKKRTDEQVKRLMVLGQSEGLDAEDMGQVIQWISDVQYEATKDKAWKSLTEFAAENIINGWKGHYLEYKEFVKAMIKQGSKDA